MRAAKSKKTAPAANAAPRLLAWYDLNRRDLPWRYAPGTPADPYRVWLSEIMLQQTVVKAVIPFFETFVRRWPTVADLAAAPLDDVLSAWAGLGYYSRARNLHAAAQTVARDHGGIFPADEADLGKLPGIGPYTAAAIASIGMGLKATPVDGNIERVVARLFSVTARLPAAKPKLRQLAATLTPDQRAGDFAQAMMDLGATICTPRNPTCLMCPMMTLCRAHEQGVAPSLPRKAVKPERPTRFGVAFVAFSRDGQILLRKRRPTGLLGGMDEVPSTDWSETMPGANAIATAAPMAADFRTTTGSVSHVFTHFRLELEIRVAAVEHTAVVPPLFWAPLDTLASRALPSVMMKVIAHARASVEGESKSTARKNNRRRA